MFTFPSSRLRALGVAAAVALSGPAQAGLVGQSISGELYLAGGSANLFDPTFHFALPTAGNAGGTTVTVGAPLEFGIGDSSAQITADFSDDQLVIGEFANLGGIASPLVMRFTSTTAGLFQSVSLLASDFAPGLSYQLADDTLEIRWAGGAIPAHSGLSATFDIGTTAAASVPEPASLALVALALGAGLFVSRREPLR